MATSGFAAKRKAADKQEAAAAKSIALAIRLREEELAHVRGHTWARGGAGRERKMAKTTVEDVPRIVFRFCRDIFWLLLTAYLIAWALGFV